MTDQTESASECDALLIDFDLMANHIVRPTGNDAARAARAIRALEAKVREVTAERDHLRQHHDGHMPDCGGWDPAANMCGCGYLQGEAYRELRADRDRLAGEVEEWKARCAERNGAHSRQVAVLSAELAAARENEARWLWWRDFGHRTPYMRIGAEYSPSEVDAAIDAARRAGGEG